MTHTDEDLKFMYEAVSTAQIQERIQMLDDEDIAHSLPEREVLKAELERRIERAAS